MPLTRMRRLSEPLFDGMRRRLSRTCRCKTQHEARLCLWNCCRTKRLAEHGDVADALDMVVSMADPDPDTDGCNWQESSILMAE